MAPDSSRTIILGSLPALVEERTVRMAAPLHVSLPPAYDDAWTAAPRAATRKKEPTKDRLARPRRTMLVPVVMSLAALLLGVGTGYVVREPSAVAAPRSRAPHEVVGVAVGMDTKVRAKNEAPVAEASPLPVDVPKASPPVARRPAAPPPASKPKAAKPTAGEFGDLETSFRVMP